MSYISIILLPILFVSVICNTDWQSPGCHLIGYKRTIHIEGCVAFEIMTNACRGFCTSYAIPSPESTLRSNPDHILTSRAECCAISKTHDVDANVWCYSRWRKLTFKSAASCTCSVCRQA